MTIAYEKERIYNKARKETIEECVSIIDNYPDNINDKSEENAAIFESLNRLLHRLKKLEDDVSTIPLPYSKCDLGMYFGYYTNREGNDIPSCTDDD